MGLAEVEHLLRLGDAADQRAGKGAAAEDEVADRGRGVRRFRHADQRHRAVALEQAEELVEIMGGGDRVQDEVEAVGMLGHLVGVLGHDQLLGTEPPGVVALVRRSGEDIDLRPHRRGDLYAHMAEPAEPDDADLLAGADLPVLERRVGGDPGAQQRRDRGKILFVMADLQHEALIDHDMVGIAAKGVAAEYGIGAVIGADETGALAILLLAIVARGAVAAAVDHAADTRDVADLELGDVAADRGDAADDLVTRHAGKQRALPLRTGGVEVGVADAAEQDVDRDVLGAGVAALKREGGKRRGRRLGRIGLGWGGHGSSSWKRGGGVAAGRDMGSGLRFARGVGKSFQIVMV